jgi:hypothetical protein
MNHLAFLELIQLPFMPPCHQRNDRAAIMPEARHPPPGTGQRIPNK